MQKGAIKTKDNETEQTKQTEHSASHTEQNTFAGMSFPDKAETNGIATTFPVKMKLCKYCEKTLRQKYVLRRIDRQNDKRRKVDCYICKYYTFGSEFEVSEAPVPVKTTWNNRGAL